MDINSALDIFIRVISACLLGAAIGLERELTNKYAGLRTNILVCLGACIFTIISIYGFPTAVSGDNPNGIRDTARVAAQVVTGIGFIGGGTVLRHGATVFGLTTAATLWMVASIGMACGAGLYSLALISTVISIVILVSVRFFELIMPVKSTKNTSRLEIKMICASSFADKIYNFVVDEYSDIFEITKKNINDETQISVIVEVFGKNSINSTYKKFNNLEGVKSLSVEEFKD